MRNGKRKRGERSRQPDDRAGAREYKEIIQRDNTKGENIGGEQRRKTLRSLPRYCSSIVMLSGVI